jgi:hypothetical protein
MRKDFLNFLKAIFIFSLIAAAITCIASVTFAGTKINYISWLILFYFVIVTIIFHFGLLKSSEGKPQAFIRYYMGATTFKLFIHVVVILMYCLFNRNDAVRFIITFLIFYILYTVFEVWVSAKRFRK